MANENYRELIEQLKLARENGAYMMCVFRIENGRLKLYRQTQNFPMGDIKTAIKMLTEDLEGVRNKVTPAGVKT